MPGIAGLVSQAGVQNSMQRVTVLRFLTTLGVIELFILASLVRSEQRKGNEDKKCVQEEKAPFIRRTIDKEATDAIIDGVHTAVNIY